MIDLTPLDVRKKRGDFGKSLRGYDPPEVDGFLELAAERMEELVKENLALRERVEQLGEKVVVQEGREQAVQDALVTAQELRQDVKRQASREAALLEREARGRIEVMILESEKLLTDHHAALQELERQRERFLKTFRIFLERELDTVEVEFGRAPLEDVTVDLELGKARWSIGKDETEDEDKDEYKDKDETEDKAEDEDETEDKAEDEDEDEDVEDDEAADDEVGGVEGGSASETAEVVEPVESAAVAVVTDDPPDAGLASPEEDDGATEPDERRPREGQGGGDALWLSSIMTDREEEDAE